jgi:LPXTG-motif cell wall-anchored protein
MTKQHLRRMKAMITVMAAMAAVLAMSATAAFAQVYPPDQDFGVTCTPTDPEPGDTVTCQVVGAEDGEDLEATATAEVAGVLYQDSFNADNDGNATFSFSTAGTQDGERIDVVVRGAQSGEAGDSVVVDEDDDVEPADRGEPVAAAPSTTTPSGDRLPVTGGQALLLSVVGLSLVGGGLLALRKRGDSIA